MKNQICSTHSRILIYVVKVKKAAKYL